MATITQIQQDITALNAQYSIDAKRAITYDRIQNEGREGYSTYQDVSRNHFAALAPLQSALFAAEWTADVTAARRSEWNDIVKAASARGEKWTGKDQTDAERKIGFTVTDLRIAIKLHTL